MMKKLLQTLIFTLLLVSVGANAMAQTQLRTPRQWRHVVRLRPRLAMKGAKDEQVQPDRFADLERINREVNASMGYAEEIGQDDWLSGSDCDDFVIAKLEAALDAGLPRGALRVTQVKIPGTNLGHLTLVVQVAGKGAVVLDNNFNDVRLVIQTPYDYVATQVPGTDAYWRPMTPVMGLESLIP